MKNIIGLILSLMIPIGLIGWTVLNPDVRAGQCYLNRRFEPIMVNWIRGEYAHVWVGEGDFIGTTNPKRGWIVNIKLEYDQMTEYEVSKDFIKAYYIKIPCESKELE